MLSDDELLRRLSELLRDSRQLEAELVAHIGEVDARRLYATKASSSMFSYCVEVLHLSEHEAYLRIAVGRACRKHPVLLEMLADAMSSVLEMNNSSISFGSRCHIGHTSGGGGGGGGEGLRQAV